MGIGGGTVRPWLTVRAAGGVAAIVVAVALWVVHWLILGDFRWDSRTDWIYDTAVPGSGPRAPRAAIRDLDGRIARQFEAWGVRQNQRQGTRWWKSFHISPSSLYLSARLSGHAWLAMRRHLVYVADQPGLSTPWIDAGCPGARRTGMDLLECDARDSLLGRCVVCWHRGTARIYLTAYQEHAP